MKWTFARQGGMAIAVASGVAAITALDLSHAATITIKPLGSGMPPAVLVNGDFEYGDGERFDTATSSLSQAIVSFSSRGGNAAAGRAMGEKIRLKHFTTYVASGIAAPLPAPLRGLRAPSAP